MLTAARAWVGPPHMGRHGALGGSDHLPGNHRRFLGEESGDAPKSLHHRKLVVPRLGMEGTAAAPAPLPPPKAICGEGLDGEAGMWIRYSRKRKKQERRSPKTEEEDGSGSVVTEMKTGEGEQIGSTMDSSPRGMVCSDCGTSRTPLWRQGPTGPKSLCNACGIRYRKAKRAGGPFPDASAPAPAPAAAGGVRQRRDPRARPNLSVSSKLAAPAAGAEEAGKRGEQRPRQRQEELLRLQEENRKFEPSCGKEAVEAAVLLMAMSLGLFSPSC